MKENVRNSNSLSCEFVECGLEAKVKFEGGHEKTLSMEANCKNMFRLNSEERYVFHYFTTLLFYKFVGAAYWKLSLRFFRVAFTANLTKMNSIYFQLKSSCACIPNNICRASADVTPILVFATVYCWPKPLQTRRRHVVLFMVSRSLTDFRL